MGFLSVDQPPPAGRIAWGMRGEHAVRKTCLLAPGQKHRKKHFFGSKHAKRIKWQNFSIRATKPGNKKKRPREKHKKLTSPGKSTGRAKITEVQYKVCSARKISKIHSTTNGGIAGVRNWLLHWQEMESHERNACKQYCIGTTQVT